MGWLTYRANRFWRRRRPARVVLSLVVLVLGAGITFSAAGAARTLSMADRYEERYGGEFDAIIEQAVGLPRTDELRSLPSVRSVRSITFVFGGLVRGSGDPIETLVFFGDQAAFGTRMVAGREPAGPDEFVASTSFLETTGTRIGDRFTLITLTQAQGDTSGFDTPVDEIAGPTETATLVGEFSGATNLQDNFATVLFPPSLADLGDVGISASQHVVGLRPGADLDALRSDLDRLSGGSDFGIDPADLVPEETRRAIATRGQAIAILTLVVGVAALVVTGQLLTRQARSPVDERRTLRAFGATGRQTVAEPCARAAFVVLPALFLSGPLAAAASGRFPLGFTRPAEPRPGPLLDIGHVWVPLVWCLLLVSWVAVAEARPIRRATRTAAAAPERLARSLPDPRLATGVRFAFTRDRTGRPVWSSLVGLSVVAATCVAASVFGATVDRVLDEPRRYGGADATMGQGGDQLPREWIDAVAASPRVRSLVLNDTTFVSVGAASLDLTGFDVVRGAYDPPIFEGRLPSSGDEVMLGVLAARRLGLVVGDDLTVQGQRGRAVFRVSGIGLATSGDGGDGAGEGGMLTTAGSQRVARTPSYGAAVIDLVPGATPEQVMEDLGGTVQLSRGDQPTAIVNLGHVRNLPDVIAAVLAALALMGTGHQLVVAARHRRKDLGILRSIGADRAWTTSVMHWQAGCWAAAVAAISVPLGVVAGRIVVHAFVDRVGAVPDPVVPLGTVALLAGGLILLATLVATVPVRATRRASVVASLSVE